MDGGAEGEYAGRAPGEEAYECFREVAQGVSSRTTVPRGLPPEAHVRLRRTHYHHSPTESSAQTASPRAHSAAAPAEGSGPPGSEWPRTAGAPSLLASEILGERLS